MNEVFTPDVEGCIKLRVFCENGLILIIVIICVSKPCRKASEMVRLFADLHFKPNLYAFTTSNIPRWRASDKTSYFCTVHIRNSECFCNLIICLVANQKTYFDMSIRRSKRLYILAKSDFRLIIPKEFILNLAQDKGNLL